MTRLLEELRGLKQIASETLSVVAEIADKVIPLKTKPKHTKLSGIAFLPQHRRCHQVCESLVIHIDAALDNLNNSSSAIVVSELATNTLASRPSKLPGKRVTAHTEVQMALDLLPQMSNLVAMGVREQQPLSEEQTLLLLAACRSIIKACHVSAFSERYHFSTIALRHQPL